MLIEIFSLLTSSEQNSNNPTITFFLYDNPLRMKILFSKKVLQEVVLSGQLWKGAVYNGASNTYSYIGGIDLQNNSQNIDFNFTLIPSN